MLIVSVSMESSPNVFVVALIAVMAVAIFGLYVWSVIWAWMDADRRGKPGWAVALLVALVSWPLSLVVWVVVRPKVDNDRTF